jgi:AmmeMemoRadiSam system protein B/AmmeMemoRadiSam system protein A
MEKRVRWFLIAIWIIAIVPACSSQTEPGSKPLTDRQAVALGRFYPSNPDELRNTLKGLFEKAKPKVVDSVFAIICPHAGYDFSGVIAASGYKQIDPKKKFDNIFIIASSHQVSFMGASIYNIGDYITPLGKVKVNIDLANKLINGNPVFTFNPDTDKNEHSLEVQLPFLQYWMKSKINLVPIVLGTQSAQSCKKIAEALKPYFNENNLFIISTDFSHYPKYLDAQAVDKASCEAIIAGSADNLMKVLQVNDEKNIPNLATSMCGWTSVVTLLYLTGNDPAYKFVPLDYMNSGDSKYADKSQVVGYWSIAGTKKEKKISSSTDFSISITDKKELLKIARTTIEKQIRENKKPDLNSIGYSKTLMTPGGAFVTLKEHGELRGCIGRFTSEEPLYKVIQEMAIASATQDTRFDPVTESEIVRLEIEISVLSPMKKINSIDEIVLGKHGIYIKKGWSSGTFLPQVATETGWNKEEFLGHCARDKAGIGWYGWKDAEIYIYSAEVFSEKEVNDHKD